MSLPNICDSSQGQLKDCFSIIILFIISVNYNISELLGFVKTEIQLREMTV